MDLLTCGRPFLHLEYFQCKGFSYRTSVREKLISLCRTNSANPDLLDFKLGNSARNREIVQIPKAIILHWQPNNLESWLIEVLPKVEFLLQNEWFGDEDIRLLLPYTPVIVQYLQLAEVNIDQRVHWIRANEMYAVTELTILDFKSSEPNSKYVVPSPGLLSDIRLVR
jgi:hypothetical protein